MKVFTLSTASGRWTEIAESRQFRIETDAGMFDISPPNNMIPDGRVGLRSPLGNLSIQPVSANMVALLAEDEAQESSGQKPGSAAQAQAGEKPDSLAAEQSGETGPDDLATAEHALHLFDAICSIHDSSESATGRRTRAMAKVLEKLAVARDNRWPDPLESPQAEAIRSGKVDDTEIRNLFDTMERELRLHRERAALTPANPAQGVSDLIAKYRCAPDRPLSLPTAGKTIAMGWDDFLAIAAAIGAGQ